MTLSTAGRTRYLERRGSFQLPLEVEAAFPFFTPEGERRWVAGWSPQYLNPGGSAFRTEHGGEETYWLVIRSDADAGVAEYARMTPGSRIGTVSVQCRPISPGQTEVEVRYCLTALTPEGGAVLEALDDRGYSSMLEEWRQAILATASGPD